MTDRRPSGQSPRLTASLTLAALTAFALAMDFELIAEGIESTVQVEVLRDLGVHMGQGWHYSKSLPVTEFLSFYENNQ